MSISGLQEEKLHLLSELSMEKELHSETIGRLEREREAVAATTASLEAERERVTFLEAELEATQVALLRRQRKGGDAEGGEQVSRLEAEVQRLRAELAAAASPSTNDRTELLSARRQLAASEETVAALQVQLADFIAQAEAAQESRATYDDLGLSESTLGLSQSQSASDLRAKLAAADARADRLQLEMDSVKQAAHNRVAELQEQLRQSDAQLQAARSDAAARSTSADSHAQQQEELNVLRSELSSLRETLRSRDAQLAEARAAVASAEADVRAAQQATAAQAQTAAEHKAAADKARAELSLAAASLNEVDEARERDRVTIAQATARADRAAAEVQAVRSELEAARAAARASAGTHIRRESTDGEHTEDRSLGRTLSDAQVQAQLVAAYQRGRTEGEASLDSLRRTLVAERSAAEEGRAAAAAALRASRAAYMRELRDAIAEVSSIMGAQGRFTKTLESLIV